MTSERNVTAESATFYLIVINVFSAGPLYDYNALWYRYGDAFKQQVGHNSSSVIKLKCVRIFKKCLFKYCVLKEKLQFFNKCLNGSAISSNPKHFE